MNITICTKIRKVKGGFIVNLRWPYGPDPGGYGEVICKDFGEVIEVLREAQEGIKP